MTDLFFPSHLSIASIRKIFTDDYEYWRVLILFHRIICMIRIQENYSDNKSKENAVFIHSEFLRMILGDNYCGILKKISHLIECNKYYIPQTQSMQYSIIGYCGFKVYRHNNVRTRALTILQKIKYKDLDAKKYPIRVKVSDITRDFKLHNDVLKEEELLNRYLASHTLPQDFLYAFNNNLINGTIDSFGNRLHTNVTSLKKEFRKYLYFDGLDDEEVCEKDFANSQFYFLAFANKFVSQYPSSEFNFINSIYNKYESEADFQEFRFVCSRGEFYQNLIDDFNLQFDMNIDKKLLKKILFKLVYGDLKIWKWKYEKEGMNIQASLKKQCRISLTDSVLGIYQILLAKYPSFLNIMFELKSTRWTFNTSKKGKSTNNCLLAQQIESDIVYDKICSYLLKNGITQFTTIHDSFIILKRDEAKFLYLVDQIFLELTVPSPKIR